MFVAYSDCTFHPDESSPAAVTRGDGDLLVDASELGVAPGYVPPEVVALERAPGVVRRFERYGREYLVDSKAGTRVFVGWSYWEEDATDVPGVTPCVNFKVRND